MKHIHSTDDLRDIDVGETAIYHVGCLIGACVTNTALFRLRDRLLNESGWYFTTDSTGSGKCWVRMDGMPTKWELKQRLVERSPMDIGTFEYRCKRLA